jgi:DNA-binding NarL/FixJ family response regulator
MSIKVVLADDHPVVYEGISKNCGPKVEVAQQVKNIENLLAILDDEQPDVLVTEVRLNGQDALKVIEELKEHQPDMKVVVYSGWNNPTYIARASSIGCEDYVPKTGPLEKLFESIETAARGEKPPEDSLIVIAQTKMRRPRQTFDHDVPLTNREMQVLRHVSMGLSNREIGKSLGISVETVKEHVQNILRKLDVNDRTQAAVWAVKRGLA